MKQRLALAFSSCLFVGFFPYAPGTLASALAAAALYHLPGGAIYFIFPILLAGFLSTAVVLRHSKHIDPSYVVIDEWVGMWLSLAAMPKAAYSYIAAFIIFRIFDILKPWPISLAEKAPGALAVMLDDLAAGALTIVVMMYLF